MKSAETIVLNGTLVSVEAHLNGRRQVAVRFWSPADDRELLVTRFDVVSDLARKRVEHDLEERGISAETVAEARTLLEELASQAMDRGEDDLAFHPQETPATLQPPPTEAEIVALWESCKSLASLPNILAHVVRTIHQLGVAGAGFLVALLYLALVSRLLKRPVSVVIKGPSAGGKSYPVEQTLRLMPPETYYALTAMSEHALAYSEESLVHRMLVLYEAAGMSGGFASYLIRSLLSEGRLRYETVEKTDEGLRSRLIEREGPTGLVLTTTKAKLHPENETRLLSITVADTPEQTKVVMQAIASATEPELEAEPWYALQRWLAAGERRIQVPYAKILAEQIPPVAVRLRRDFGMLLTLIQSHALLHRATRARDAIGRIIATVGDYAAVRELVADALAEMVEVSVPKTVRETVHAVKRCQGDKGKDHEVTVAAVAKALGLDKSAAHRRVQNAITKGFLINHEDKRGRAARLVLGAPLPEDRVLLPEPKTVMDALEVSDPCNPECAALQGLEPAVAGLQSSPEQREVAPTAGSEGFTAGDVWEPAG